MTRKTMHYEEIALGVLDRWKRELCWLGLTTLVFWTLLAFTGSAETVAQRQGPVISSPTRLPHGQLIDGKLYSAVLPGNGINRDDPLVDWDYGFWEYDVFAKEAKLLLPLKDFPWLEYVSFAGKLQDQRLIFNIADESKVETDVDFWRLYLVSVTESATSVEVSSLQAFEFELYGLCPQLSKVSNYFVLSTPHAFKVLTNEDLLNSSGWNVLVKPPEVKWGENSEANVLPINTGGTSHPELFLLVDTSFGFRVINSAGDLLFQGAHVIPEELVQAYQYFTGDPRGLSKLLSAIYPFRPIYSVVTFLGYPRAEITQENLVVLYDPELYIVFICSPTGTLYMFQREPAWNILSKGTDFPDKDVVAGGIIQGDRYLLLYEDATYFEVDFGVVARKVRSNKLNPLGGPLEDALLEMRNKQ